MNNSIQIFTNPQFGEIRTAGTADNPLFCLSDICKVLELRVDGVMPRLKEGGYNRIGVGVQTGVKKDGTPAIQNVEMLFVNEQNLYKVIMRSDKPQAEPFQDWVCGEVLPSIRKHGMYATAATIDSIIADPESGIKLLQALKVEREQRKLAEEKTEHLLLENKEQAEKIKADAPLVTFANAIVGSTTSCLIGELAKILRQNGVETGERRLFEWMRANGYLGRHGERYNIPNQEYIERGYFELKKGTRSGNGGVLHTTITTKVTPKGQEYFINKLLKM